jgi:hypothetical protein
MKQSKASIDLSRRSVLKMAGAIGLSQIVFAPFVQTARAAETVKIGLDNPLTGTYAALGKNELLGAQLALDQINAKAAFSDAKPNFCSRTRPAAMPGQRSRRPASSSIAIK